jgi:hypothetical protein
LASIAACTVWPVRDVAVAGILEVDVVLGCRILGTLDDGVEERVTRRRVANHGDLEARGGCGLSATPLAAGGLGGFSTAAASRGGEHERQCRDCQQGSLGEFEHHCPFGWLGICQGRYMVPRRSLRNVREHTQLR